MVIFNELFQTVRLSKWYMHFDTPSFYSSSDTENLFILTHRKFEDKTLKNHSE